MESSSREYQKFLREEQSAKELSFYERMCTLSEKILPIPLPMSGGLEKKYKEAIEFSHLKITPKSAYAFAFVTAWLIFVVSMTMIILLNSFSISSVIFSVFLASLALYFLLNYPMHHATVYRINASSEMVLAAIYMSISMHLSPNLENAVRFAAKNLKSSMAKDLRELVWGVYTRTFDRMEDALDYFIKKWQRDSKEFATALYLIKNSGSESQEKRERYLDEAVSVILDGTKERMRTYARELKQPVTILNALGILLPIIGLVFFPIVSIFLPDLIKPVLLIVGYDILLPLIVFLLISNYLENRPYSFHQPDLSNYREFKTDKFYEKLYTIPLIVSVPLVLFGLVALIGAEEIFSFKLLVYSMLIVLGLSLGVVSYSYLSVSRKLKIRNEVVEIETEFAEALFQLGSLLTRGIPLETALRRTQSEIKNLKISAFFERILYNIESFGMTFERAVFDEQSGAIRYYPSSLIEASMNVITETSKRGMKSSAKSMVVISKYLKDMHEVDEELKNMMEDVTSTMSMQAILLAPLSAGVVVTLASIMTRLLIKLGDALDSIYSSLGSSLGPASDLGAGAISTIFNISSIIPVHGFQLIVGIYLVEIVTLISVSLSIISNGDEGLMKKLTVSRTLAISTAIYFVTLLTTYYLFTSVIPIEDIIV